MQRLLGIIILLWTFLMLLFPFEGMPADMRRWLGLHWEMYIVGFPLWFSAVFTGVIVGCRLIREKY